MEVQIIRNELNGTKLRDLSEDDFYNQLIDVWTALKYIAGTIMYTPPESAGKFNELAIQVDVLQRFVASNPLYMALTGLELLHAFYLNNNGALGEVYRHYNQPLNAQFVGDVLNGYLAYKRKMYGRAMDDIKKMLTPPPPKEVVKPTVQELQAMIQEDYDLYKEGETNMIFNAVPKYAYLRRIGGIDFPDPRGTFLKYYERAFEWRISMARIQRNDVVVRSLEQGRTTGQILKSEHLYLVYLSRKLIYFRFFDMMIYFKVKDIFKEIKP